MKLQVVLISKLSVPDVSYAILNIVNYSANYNQRREVFF